MEISFDAFGLSLDPTSASVQMKNCQLWIDLGSDKKRMLAVREFTFSGVRSLGPGQLARVATDLGWSGQLPSKNGVTFIGPTAPGDESFSFTDRRPEDNFSSCDTQARLIVNVSASLSATGSDAHPPSSGYLKILQARSDGSPSEVRLAMTARDCDATGEEKR